MDGVRTSSVLCLDSERNVGGWRTHCLLMYAFIRMPPVPLSLASRTAYVPEGRMYAPTAGRSLFDALPKKLESRILSINHASFPVLAGDKKQAIIALKFEPSDILDAAPIWRACVLQVVSDSLRFQAG